MKTYITLALIVLGLAGPTPAVAQEGNPGPGAVELTLIPGGGTYFTKGTDTGSADFTNYDVGAAIAMNFNRFVGFEAELSGAFGIENDFGFGNLAADQRSPNLLNYSGNIVLSAANGSSVVPYLTGGVGGMTLLDSERLEIRDVETFLTGNVGGGVKWYEGRWGLRADYRFITVASKDDAPAFWGNEKRFGHRVYGALIFNWRQ